MSGSHGMEAPGDSREPSRGHLRLDFLESNYLNFNALAPGELHPKPPNSKMEGHWQKQGMPERHPRLQTRHLEKLENKRRARDCGSASLRLTCPRHGETNLTQQVAPSTSSALARGSDSEGRSSVGLRQSGPYRSTASARETTCSHQPRRPRRRRRAKS